MKAALYRRTGTATEVLVVEDIRAPLPAPGEVLVRVHYSGVNPSDVKSRAGVSSPTLPYDFVVPHSDGAGEIEAIGAGVDNALVGRRVWFYHAQWQRQFGSAAEYVCLPLQQVVELPPGVSFEVGAAIGIPLLTAHHAVARYGDVNGKSVLISGGAGAVGFYAAQLAKRAGARVITTVSSAEKATQAKVAGPDLVLNYAQPQHLIDEVMRFTNGKGVDRIIEVNASANAALHPDLLAMGGSVVVYGSAAADIPVSYRGMMRRFASLHFFIVYMLPPEQLAESIAVCNALLASNALRHLPTVIYGLDEIAAAHRHVESGKPGKVLVRI